MSISGFLDRRAVFEAQGIAEIFSFILSAEPFVEVVVVMAAKEHGFYFMLSCQLVLVSDELSAWLKEAEHFLLFQVFVLLKVVGLPGGKKNHFLLILLFEDY